MQLQQRLCTILCTRSISHIRSYGQSLPYCKHLTSSARGLASARLTMYADREHTTSDNEPAYFWMPDDKPYGAFSHWYEAPMADQEGIKYPTVEQYMMYHKAVLFKDTSMAEQILASNDPEEAKAAGRKVHGFDSEVWKAHCDQIVYEGNFLKFSQNATLAALLLDTGDRPLVEASPEDSLWGIGYSAEDAANNKASWGQNLCGKAIEKVRTAVRNT